MGDMVQITVEEYEQLKRSSYALQCLENGGVDNWEWYYESMIPYYKKYDPDFGEDEGDLYD